jgi:hypothetical protein
MSAGVFLTNLHRADFIHVKMILPYAALTGIAGVCAVFENFELRPILSGNSLRFAILSAMGLTVLLVVVQVKKSHDALHANLHLVAYGLPRDSKIVGANNIEVGKALRADGGSCTYIFDNQQIFYHLSGLPPCSRFVIPVYAGHDVESSVLTDLQRGAPNEVVLRSDFWSWSIDGFDQAKRTPTLYAWLRDHYTPVATFGGVVVARRNMKESVRYRE